MRGFEMHSAAADRSLVFAVVFAALLTLTRLLVLLRADVDISGYYLVGLLFSFSLQGFYGLLLGYLTARCGGRIATALPWVMVTLMVFINILCFHYEAVFGRLPGVQLLFYLDQLAELSASLRSNVPVQLVVAEVLAAVGVLALAWRKLDGTRLSPVAKRLLWLPATILALAIGVNAVPGALPEAMHWASRDPLIWLARSGFIKESYDLRKLRLSQQDFDRFLNLHGQADPGPVLDREFPLCRPRPEPDLVPTGQSVIVLILESVGYHELIGDFRGLPLMPNLRRIAAENVSFRRAMAPSTKSIQTLTALFSGLPPQPFNYYLWETPLLNFDGLPRQLQREGYDTVYFHGGDLSFERQRHYLRAVGFGAVHEYDQKRDLPIYGWGYDDATMFGELRRWLEGRKAGAAPYLATLFTLSSHDPYILPGDWTPVFSTQARQLRAANDCCAVTGESDAATAAAESYRFLDAQLAEFYSWYAGLPQRPLLVILGDHAPHVLNDDAVTAGRTMRFDIPLIIAGLDPAVGRVRDDAVGRPVAVHDVPVTLSHVLGIRVHPCMIGRNLLDPEYSPVPVYGVGPESMEQIHVWIGDGEYRYDRVTEQYAVLRAAHRQPAAQAMAAVRSFVEATFPVHYYLLKKNAYFPPLHADSHRPVLPQVTRPLFAAHRGNTQGPQSAHLENSRAALDRAAAGPVPWLELDVQITADGIPVLLHDPTVDVDGQEVAVSDLTLQQLRSRPGREAILTLEQALADYLPRKKLLIEAKPQARFQISSQLSRAVVSLLGRHQAQGRVIIDSFDEFLATSIKQQCDCQVGLDTPSQKVLTDADLEHYRRLGVDWIYVEQSVVNADLVRSAHARDLKVMAYTVNEQTTLDLWRAQGALPDGVITDYEAISRGQ